MAVGLGLAAVGGRGVGGIVGMVGSSFVARTAAVELTTRGVRSVRRPSRALATCQLRSVPSPCPAPRPADTWERALLPH